MTTTTTTQKRSVQLLTLTSLIYDSQRIKYLFLEYFGPSFSLLNLPASLHFLQSLSYDTPIE